jgi:RND family efflux transporter MFP subunit
MRLLFFLSLAVLAGCSGPYATENVVAKETTPIPVTAIRIAENSIPEIVTANGELFAEEVANVTAKVSGRVQKIHVDLGSVVKQGDVLVELEKTDYEIRVQQAAALVEQIRARLGILNKADDSVVPEQVANVREADAALKEARFILETTAKLAKDGVVSRIEYEKANVRAQGVEARYQAAISEVMQLRSQLSERRAQLALARQQLEDSTIVAPFSGAITRRAASLGEFLPVNAAVVTLVRQNPLRVRLEVPERQAARIQKGQTIHIQMQGVTTSPVGRIVRLSPAIEAQNRSLLIEGEIPNPDGVLRPGSFVEGIITVDAGAVGIAVPTAAIVSFAGIERAYVIGDNGVLEDRVLKTGRGIANDQVVVTEGLKSGERIVAKATDRLSKGQKVQVR